MIGPQHANHPILAPSMMRLNRGHPPQNPLRADLRSARVEYGTIVPPSSVIGDGYRDSLSVTTFLIKWPARVIPDGPILATLPKAASSAALRQPTYVTRQ